MKKFSLILFFCVAAMSANAQLKMNSSGKIAIGISYPSYVPKLSVGPEFINGSYSSNSIGIAASPTIIDNGRNVALQGYVSANSTYTSESNFGVVGISCLNNNHGRNYGLFASLSFSSPTSTTGGAGLYATNYAYLYQNPNNLSGIYAIYINGSTNLGGRTTAQEIYTPADEQLSENVESIAENSRDGDGTQTLDNLLKMNVLEFNMKNAQKVDAPERAEEMTDEMRESYEYMRKDQEEMYSRRHFGVSAQELQEIYPNLVLEGQDGYLYVNYTELVPILIRSIQELKLQLDELKDCKKDEAAESRLSDRGFDDGGITGLSNSIVIPSTASLEQNTPNPFTERTTIRFTLPDDCKNASICIFDMTGKMLKQLPVNPTMQSIIIEGYEFPAGMYIYSLLIGGKEVKTRRMILSK